MKNRVPMAVCDHFTSAFADTGENMNLKPNAIREKIETTAMAPRWVRALKPVWIVHHRLRRLAAGHFFTEADGLFHLHVRQPGTACHLRRAQTHGHLAEPAGPGGTAYQELNCHPFHGGIG